MRRYIIIFLEDGDQFVTTKLEDSTVIAYADGDANIIRVDDSGDIYFIDEKFILSSDNFLDPTESLEERNLIPWVKIDPLG
jgi:hypothetical protein